MWRILDSSYRGGVGMDSSSRLAASWDPRTAVEMLVPLFFGPPDQRFWGEMVWRTMRPLFFSLYPGVLAIALVIGAGRPRQPSSRWAWWMILAGGFLALGGWNPVMFQFFRLPFASGLRYPIKAWILVAIGASLLAGIGFERAFLRQSRRPILLALAGLGATIAVAVVILTVRLQPTIDALAARITPAIPLQTAIDEVHRWRSALLLSLVLLALGALLLAFSRRRPRIAGCLLLSIHVAAQFILLQPLLDTDDTAAYREPPPALRYVAHDERVAHGCSIAVGCDTGHRGSYEDHRLAWLQRRGWAELYPFAGAQYGLRYSFNVSPERLDTLLVFAAQRAMREVPEDQAVRLLAAAAVDVLLLDRPVAEVARNLVDLRARLPSIAGELFVYGIKDSAPEARLARSVRSGDIRRVLVEMTAPGFDAARDAFLPGRPPGTIELEGGTAGIESESWERLRVTTDSAGPGLLVLGRAWLPHYRARVDGAPAATLQANFGQLAVDLPPGRHTVEIWADRTPFVAALGVAAAGGLGLLGLLVWGTRRDRALAIGSTAPTCHPATAGKESVG
jgi:hypothetical protein